MPNVYDNDGHRLGGWSQVTDFEVDLRVFLGKLDVSAGLTPDVWTIDGRRLTAAEQFRAQMATAEDWEASKVALPIWD